MCLKRIDDKKTAKLKASDGPIEGYKVLIKKGKSLYSPYYDNFEWSQNANHDSGRASTELTPKEIRYRDVYAGFHFYSALSDAKTMCENWDFLDESVVVGIFEVMPCDVVAVGRDDIGSIARPKECESFVATRAKFVGVKKCV